MPIFYHIFNNVHQFGVTQIQNIYFPYFVYKKIIRIISNRGYLDHTQPYLIKWKFLNFVILIGYKLVYICTSQYTQEILQSLSSYHNTINYPTCTREYLRVPQHNLSVFQHSLAYSGPKICNFLPNLVQISPALHTFK